MTIPEADAVSTLLRYLAPGSTVPAEELRAAATRLREHAQAATPGPWSVGNGEIIGLGIEQTGRGTFRYAAKLARVIDDEQRDEDNCQNRTLGSTEADARWIAMMHPGLAEWLANLLDDLADEAEATYATEVHLGPDTTYATGVVDYRGELRSHLTHALATARTILGAAEQPGGEPAPAEQPVAASTLRPGMVVSHPAWNGGHRVRIVTAHDDGSQVVIHYRDVRVRRPDAVVVVPPDFQVTPGAGFEDGAR